MVTPTKTIEVDGSALHGIGSLCGSHVYGFVKISSQNGHVNCRLRLAMSLQTHGEWQSTSRILQEPSTFEPTASAID